MSENGAYEGPAVIELMGHRRLAGHVSEAEMFGTKLLRVDVAQGDGQVATQLYGGGAIYCLTPTTEEVVERMSRLASNSVKPIERWELPAPEEDEDGQDHFHYDEDDLNDGERF